MQDFHSRPLLFGEFGEISMKHRASFPPQDGRTLLLQCIGMSHVTARQWSASGWAPSGFKVAENESFSTNSSTRRGWRLTISSFVQHNNH